MKKLQHSQRTISLKQGDSQVEMDMTDIHGPIVGYATRVIGTIPAGKSADISIMDGASTVLMPIDTSVSETTTKNSFAGLVSPLKVDNPGRIKAVVTPSEPLAVGEEYKVKVIVFYAVETNAYNSPSLNDCM